MEETKPVPAVPDSRPDAPDAYDYWLTCVHGGIRDTEKRQLLSAFGSAKAVFTADAGRLRESRILTEEKTEALLRLRSEADPDRAWQAFAETGMGLVTLAQRTYPKRLAQIYDAPYGLFYLGEAPGLLSDDVPTVAIVGARTCTGYGRTMGEDIAAALAEAGAAVISGMARGIDQSGHRGCLSRNGKTIAVLGSGADVCYPPQSIALYEEIRQTGCILSEQPPHTQPLPMFFPSRNRIISGMADAVLVLEAKKKSGSLITADFAMEQGKDVFALPGRVGDPMSEGTNDLIAQGAHIIRSVPGLLEDLFDLTLAQRVRFPDEKAVRPLLDPDTEAVYQMLDVYPANLDEILAGSGLDMLQALRSLMRLCDLGLAKECFNNQYIRGR